MNSTYYETALKCMRDQCAAGDYDTKPTAVKNCMMQMAEKFVQEFEKIHEARIAQPGTDIMLAVRQYLDVKSMCAEIAAHLREEQEAGGNAIATAPPSTAMQTDDAPANASSPSDNQSRRDSRAMKPACGG